MKLLFIISRWDKPSTRIRIRSYLPFLKEKGMKWDILETGKHKISRYALFLKAHTYDVCMIQKKMLTGLELTLLRKTAKKIIFDFDDAISYDDEGEERKSVLASFEKTLEISDLVICGNEYLEQLAKKKQPSTVLLPSPVDTTQITCKKPLCSTPPCLGWVGSPTTFRYFAQFETEWLQLQKQEKARFKVISKGNPPLSLSYDFCEWQENLEYEHIRTFDMGLSPLPNNRFTKGKCAYKILQYQASGVPTLASQTGYNMKVIDHLNTGLLIPKQGSWSDAVRSLLESPSLYEKISLQGRQFVCDTHSLQKLRERFLTILRSV